MKTEKHLFLSCFQTVQLKHTINLSLFSGNFFILLLYIGPSFQKLLLQSFPPKQVIECCICQSQLNEKTILDCCSHFYCYDCIKKWISYKSTCPLCRKKITYIKKTK